MDHLERPTEALDHLFSGQANESDLISAKLYFDRLERFLDSRAYPQPDPKKNGPFEIARYAFCAPDAAEGKSRDFIVTIFKDRTCTWQDEQGKLKSRTDRLIVLKTILGDAKAERALKREEDEFTITGTIGDKAYWLIVEKELILSQGGDLDGSILSAIDAELAPSFWRDVNPFLPNPLKQIK